MPASGRVASASEIDWLNFWNEIDQLNVWDWNASNLEIAFPEREGAAGCGVPQFFFICASDNKCKLLQASNRYPPNWAQLNTLLMDRINKGAPKTLTQDEIKAAQESLAVFNKAIQDLCETMKITRSELFAGNNSLTFQDLIHAVNKLV